MSICCLSASASIFLVSLWPENHLVLAVNLNFILENKFNDSEEHK
jgi:hypothetical protein